MNTQYLGEVSINTVKNYTIKLFANFQVIQD